MEIELKLNFSDSAVKYWVEYAVLHGWKRPRSWSKSERRDAVLYALKLRLLDIEAITELFAAADAEAAE